MRRSGLLLLAALAAGSASAQPRALPLDEALALARRQSVAVLRAAADEASAEAALAAVRAERWPSLAASVGAGQRYGLGFDETTGALTQETVEAVDAGLFGEAVVFDGAERRRRERAAAAARRAAALGGEEAARGAAVAVVRGYLAVAQAEAARAVAEAEVAAQERLSDLVAAQVEAGARPASETAEQAERLAAARLSALLAERDGALARADLVRLLGLDPAAEHAFPAPSFDGPAASASADSLAARALRQRPDVRAAAASARAAAASLGAARAGRLPRVSLTGGVGTGFTSTSAAAGVLGQFGDNRAGSVGLRVSVPLLDRGAARAGVRRSEAALVAAQVGAEATAREAAYEVRAAAVELDALGARLALAETRVEAARVALDAETARYEAGAASFQTVAQLRARLVDAETQRAVLAASVGFGRLLLALAAGEGGP